MKSETVWLVGERPRMLSLLSTLLPPDQRDAFRSHCGKDSVASAVYSEKDSFHAEGNTVELRSSSIPMGLRVELHETLEHCQCGLLLLLFSFRFEKYLNPTINEIVKLIPTAENTPLRIKIILYDDPDIHTGVTDMENQESELERMHKTVYQKLEDSGLHRIVEVVPYHENDGYMLFLGGEGSLCYMSDMFVKQFKNLNIEISHFGNDSYQIIQFQIKQELDSEARKSITKYERVRDSDDMIRTYAETLLAGKVWDQFMSKLGEEYCNCLSPIAFWDMEYEWERISESIRKKSLDFLIREHKAVRIKGMSEYDYSKLLADKKYDSRFFQDVSKLVETKVLQWMLEEMRDYVSLYDASV